jgi:hypothetical protein
MTEKYEKGQQITHVNCGEMRILCKDCREGTRHEL